MNSHNTDAAQGWDRAADLQFAKQIDSICDSFEASWKSGHRPELSEYLLRTESPQSTLFVELVLIDIAYRRRHGEDPAIDEYAERFPTYKDVLAELSALSDTGQMRTVVPAALVEKLDRFELVDRLGEGAFGVVWKAWDTKMERWVALKQFRSIAPQQQKIFDREARAVAQLNHDNVVRVLEIQQQSDAAFIVFELVEGLTLSRWIRKQWSDPDQPGVRPEDAAHIARQLADGLQQVHEKGVIHRDFKPGNILLDQQETPKIADFGLARHIDALTTISDEKMILGTVPYMSPEQCGGREVDRRTDLYSLGVVLYEMLTGHRPFEGSRSELLQRIPHEPPVPPRRLVEGIPASLENICLKALAKEREDRYPTAAAMQADLERFLQGDDIAASRPSLPVRVTRWMKRNFQLTVTAAVAFFAVALAAGAITTMINTMPEDGRRPVWLSTNPEGAKIAFVPLDKITGEPRPHEIHHAKGVSPIRERLLPGNYLVVAYLDDGSNRFHEVYRRVPETIEKLVGAFNHNTWRIDRDDMKTVILPGIRLPEDDVTEGMAYVKGDEQARIGIRGSPVVPQHERSIPGFYIDPVEMTLFEYQAHRDFRVMRPPDLRWRQPPTDEHAITLNWDEAVYEIEATGKRLPHEVEYEFAALHAARKDSHPWTRLQDKDEEFLAEAAKQDEFLPVGQPEFDRVETDPPIYGLFSNVAEWTMTWGTAYYPGQEAHAGRVGAYPSLIDLRVVKGGDAQTLGDDPDNGDPAINLESRDPRNRLLLSRWNVRRGLGLRGVRSVRPRLTPEDFIRVVEPEH